MNISNHFLSEQGENEFILMEAHFDAYHAEPDL